MISGVTANFTDVEIGYIGMASKNHIAGPKDDSIVGISGNIINELEDCIVSGNGGGCT